jgi:hypothetical protein
MAILINIEDHPRTGRCILTMERFPGNVDALTRAYELLREAEVRRRALLPILLNLWIECDDGSVMNDTAVRRAILDFGMCEVRRQSALEVKTFG